MRDFSEDITVGLHLLYDGEPIEWCSNNGKVVETMRRGPFIVSRVTSEFIYLKPDRKGAVTEHCFSKTDISNVKVLEFGDLTTSVGVLGIRLLGGRWYINDKELINKAKKYNKSNR